MHEFYDPVARREGVNTAVTVRHARAVTTVLQTAVTGGELDDVRSRLGKGYKELIGQSGSTAQLG